MSITDLSYVTVTGTWRNLLTGAPSGGTVRFSVSGRWVNQGTEQIVVPEDFSVALDADGSISVDLPATDDPDFIPSDRFWRVTEFIDGHTRTYAIVLPADPATQDLADIAPIDPTSSGAVYVLAGSHVAATDVTVDTSGFTHSSATNAQDVLADFDAVFSGEVTSVTGDTEAVVDNTNPTQPVLSIGAGIARDSEVTAAVATETSRATTAEGLLVPKTTTVNGHALSANVTVTSSDVGLGNVTNDAQLKAADLDNDTTLAADSATKVPSQHAVKTYVTGAVGGSGSLIAANNLSDVANASTSRTNLGVPAGSGTSTGTNTGDQTITLTGDATGSGTGSFAVTLATVNSSPGSFGDASHSLTATVNAKGLITALSSQSIAIAESQVTSLVSDLAAKQPLDATLTALAAANWAANALPVGTGADTLSQTAFAANTFPARSSSGNLVAKTITDFGLSLVDDTDAATARTTLGLGTLATQSGTFSGTSSGTNTGDQTITLTGDVTGSGTGSFAATIANDAVTYAKMQNVSATSRIMGRATAGAGDMEELTASQAKTILAIAESDVTNLTTDLAAKAPLASPAFTGHPTGVTESAGDNSTRLATTAYADAKVSDTAYAGSWDAVTGIAPSKNAVYDQMQLMAPLASPTLTGTPAAPTAAVGTNTTQVATTAYVQGELEGRLLKVPVRVATTAAGTLSSSFANGSSVDAVTLATGDRILIKDQASGAENGLYTVNASGAPTRASDASIGAEVTKAAVQVLAGTANKGTVWWQTATITTIGTDAQTWARVLLGNIGVGTNAVALGVSSSATQNKNLAVGYNAQSTGTDQAVAVGNDTSASGNGSLAFGARASASGTAASALGIDASATGSGCLSAGWAAQSTATNATALGTSTAAAHDGGVAIGIDNVSGAAATAAINDFVLGTANHNVKVPGTLKVAGVSVVDLSSTQTLTNKWIKPRSGTTASSGTPTINTDTTDFYDITAQAAAITSFTTNLSGTPVNGQKLMIRILDNGTARAITWGTSFYNAGVALPTTTTVNKELTVGFIYSTNRSKWGCVASTIEA